MAANFATVRRKMEFPTLHWRIGRKIRKYVVIKHNGSLYYNYKSTHSVVLMALADAEYNFNTFMLEVLVEFLMGVFLIDAPCQINWILIV